MYNNTRCVHYVGFRDDRYWNAYRIWGGPRFIHRWWDTRAKREIGEDDIVIFAEGDWQQEPKPFTAPDIDERYLTGGEDEKENTDKVCVYQEGSQAAGPQGQGP